MRPGESADVQTAYKLLEAMFFDPRKFDFLARGRLKFNIKMGKPERDRINDPLLSAKDFYEVVAYVLKMRKSPSEYQADDIDHLGNRRVRPVGGCLKNQFPLVSSGWNAHQGKDVDPSGNADHDAARSDQRKP